MTKLYIIATPIGNLKDITKRAIEKLKTTKHIICEDTRITKRLLNLLNIEYKEKKFLRYFEPKQIQLIPKIIPILLKNDAVLVSDSGTPVISDPGYKLLQEIRKNFSTNIDFQVLPGPNSITTALIYSGLPPDKFSFLGFLPKKKNKKINLFKKLKNISEIMKTTYIAFESPYRIKKTLTTLNELFDQSIKISICREMTKKFESIYNGSPKYLLNKINKKSLKTKGEFVIVFHFYQAN